MIRTPFTVALDDDSATILLIGSYVHQLCPPQAGHDAAHGWESDLLGFGQTG